MYGLHRGKLTEKLFWKEMDLKEFDATVISVEGNEIILDRTAFYATGGGQPNDTGILQGGFGEIKVTDVMKREEDIVHLVEDPKGINTGEKIHGLIDWDRRSKHMRYHSAIHVMDGIVTRKHGDQGLLRGGQIYEDRARIDVDMQDFSRELVEKIIEECNEFIMEGHKVFQKDISREEALKMENLARTEPGRQLINSLDTVRLIVIEDLDEQADGGTHVSNTKEIGKLVLNRIQSKGKRNKRIEFTLENP
jgi:misacylated tRNA(Ala) deacylase